jgi:hypothetical protein
VSKRKDSLFTKNCLENWISACRRLKLYPCLSPCANIHSKWIKDLNIRPETLKLVQERGTCKHRQKLPKYNSNDSALTNGLHGTKKLLYSKEAVKTFFTTSEKGVHRM